MKKVLCSAEKSSVIWAEPHSRRSAEQFGRSLDHEYISNLFFTWFSASFWTVGSKKDWIDFWWNKKNSRECVGAKNKSFIAKILLYNVGGCILWGSIIWRNVNNVVFVNTSLLMFCKKAFQLDFSLDKREICRENLKCVIKNPYVSQKI